MKRIGITSLYYHNWNFGGMLQAYALCWVLRQMGCEAEQIGTNLGGGNTVMRARVWETTGRHKITRDIWDRCYQVYRRRRFPRDLRNFRRFEKEIPMGIYVGGIRGLSRLNQSYDCFITGSDQVWNPGIPKDSLLAIYGLLFADDSKRKISYAASIGAAGTAEGKEELFQKILAGMDFISVREKSAQRFLQPLTDKPVTVVLDPTLLLTRQDLDALAIGPGRENPHLFAYFLNEAGNRHDKQLHQIADQLDMPARCIADELERYPRSNSGDQQILNAGPKEFLGEIRDAEMVFTNSFHGIVFSVLFHKPFWAFKRNRDGDAGSMNARITDFLEDFGLSDRLLENGEIPAPEKLRRPIDYDKVDRILEEKRAFSLSWLKTALKGA